MKPQISEGGSDEAGKREGGGRSAVPMMSIGVPPLSPIPASRAYRRLESGSDKKQQYLSTDDMVC